MRATALAALLLAAACGRSTNETRDAGAPEAAPGAAPTTEVPAALPLAFAVPRLAATSLQTSQTMLVEAVWAATAKSGARQLGGVTSTGTLRVVGNDAVYSAEPTDRLVLEFAGKHHEFRLRSAQGDPQAADASGWLAAPHTLAWHHTLAGEADVDVDLRYDGAAFAATVRGTSWFAGHRLELALEVQGRTEGTRDLDGHDLTTRARMTGTLTGEGFRIDVREEHALQSAAAQSLRLLYSQRGSSTRIDTTSASTVTTGGHTFRFENVTSRADTTEKGGRTVHQESAVAGAVTRDGAAFGQLAMVGGVPVLQTRSRATPFVLR